jgi:hypothetical protein
MAATRITLAIFSRSPVSSSLDSSFLRTAYRRARLDFDRLRFDLQFCFDLRDRWQTGLEFFRQRFHETGTPLGHADRLLYVAQSIFDYEAIPFFAEQQADRRLVVGATQLIVHGREIKIYFASELGFEGLHFEVHYYETAQAQMIEEQVEREFFARHFQPVLSPDECEADAELDQEFLDVFEQSKLKFALPGAGVHREEVEDVRILQCLMCEIGLRRRQRAAKLVIAFPSRRCSCVSI